MTVFEGRAVAGTYPGMVGTRYRRRGGAAGIVELVTSVVVTIIVIGIVLVLLGANRHNTLVGWFLDASRWLTTPFHGVFSGRPPKQDALLNWGLAAVVYAIVGGLAARLAARA
jgi:hypothetical protein